MRKSTDFPEWIEKEEVVEKLTGINRMNRYEEDDDDDAMMG
jgi:hypothetical protein